jgi:hypothetical protein
MLALDSEWRLCREDQAPGIQGLSRAEAHVARRSVASERDGAGPKTRKMRRGGPAGGTDVTTKGLAESVAGAAGTGGDHADHQPDGGHNDRGTATAHRNTVTIGATEGEAVVGLVTKSELPVASEAQSLARTVGQSPESYRTRENGT